MTRAEADQISHQAWDAMRDTAIARGLPLSVDEKRALRWLRWRERSTLANDKVLLGLQARGIVSSVPVSRALADDPKGELAEWRLTADGYDVLAADRSGAYRAAA